MVRLQFEQTFRDYDEPGGERFFIFQFSSYQSGVFQLAQHHAGTRVEYARANARWKYCALDSACRRDIEFA